MLKGFFQFVIILFALAFAGLISSLWTSDPSKVEQPESKVARVTELKASESPSPQLTPPVKQKVKVVNSPTPTPYSTPIPASNTPTPNPTPLVTSLSSTQTNQINVSVNGSSNFSVSVHDSANQCDVLNQALADGKISSLNMRYNSNFGTYAVYQINGVGKENSVWWTYTVNGQSPNQGCSYIKTNNNDNVEWKYIGS